MSYCDCDYGDYDRAEWHNISMVKRSRKQHRCDECGGPVFIGENYERQVGKFGGDVLSHIECACCLEIREWAMISMPCFCAYEWGSLIERVKEMVSDVESEVAGFRDEWESRRYQMQLRRMAAGAIAS